MDAATLRLILIVVGAAFLVGLYLWERRRAEGHDEEHDWDNYLGNKREPNFGPLEPDDRESERDYSGSETTDEPTHQQGSGSLRDAGWDEFESEPDSEPESEPGTPRQRARAGAIDAAGGDDGEFSDEPGSPPGSLQAAATAAGQEMLLIQLFIVAVDKPFGGERILSAAERVKLVPGSMDIFHRQSAEDSARAPLFSMANMVKPGSFPLDAMEDFETPGLALFAQLTGSPSDLMVFDELLHAARVLAEQLGGDVQERGRRTLTAERAGILRGQVSALFQRRPGHPNGE